MTVPILLDISIDQFYTPTTIAAFGDSFSGLTNPPTCGLRTCSTDNAYPNVIWDIFNDDS